MIAALLAVLAVAEPLPAAPPLEVTSWVTKGPFPDAEPELLVIEVWATWCGPCHETFPELSKLQVEWGPRIRVVGLTDEEPLRVRRFYDARREQMRYALAVDETGRSVKALMFGGFDGRGIPSAYIVREGRMAWSGPPAGVRAAVAELLGPQG